tara:strand:- start:674 stop:1498 length:825 start_codon:yes stop_codon:yes gene_type:complete
MSLMALNLDNKGLKSIVNEFELFFIDIWGVLHNGINLFQNSIQVLNELEENQKKYVLLTNAPRPNLDVINFLKRIGLDKNKCQKVYTSGEAALSYLNSNWKNSKFFHIGSTRDFNLFKLFEKNKVNNINEAELLLCTGLFDDYDEDLNFYKSLLKNEIDKKMICTNPDLVVDRGEKREFCAGSVAKVFEEIGGKVNYFGKPYPLVYNQAADVKDKKVLCIGDNLNTDIRGANLQNFSSLLILNGIHKNEADYSYEKLFEKYNVSVNYVQTILKW